MSDSSPTQFRRSAGQALITGVYRSGTEFFTQTISGHPDLAATMYNINVMMWVYGQYDPIADPANLRRAIADVVTRNRVRYDVQIDGDAVYARVMAMGEPTYGTLYDALMSTLHLDRSGRRHWAEKCQLLWREIPKFLDLMPNGKAILVLRDPRSVLASFRAFTFMPPPAYLGAIFNCLDAMRHARRFRTELPADRFLVVRYEDVARRPLEEARKVHAFLGLDQERSAVDRGAWQFDGKPWQVNSMFGNEVAFDVEAAINRWRTNLDDVEVALTEFVCGSEMREFGYEPCGRTLDWPAALRRILPDPQISGWLHHFLAQGEGVEAWPVNPLDVRNWPETKDIDINKRHQDEKVKMLQVTDGDGRFPVKGREEETE